MQERLLIYFRKQCGLFIRNYDLLISDFNADAVHDMRVSFKKIRAVFLLIERLFPRDFDALAEEGRLRELFRLSGRIRDTQVQEQLLSVISLNLGSTFGEYQTYLQNTESKAIKKLNKFIKVNNVEINLKEKQEKAGHQILKAESEQVRLQIVEFVDELFKSAREMQPDYEHDENLHEIRRKLKQCHILLSVFDQNDPDLPHLNSTLKRLDKVNELLGDWHDQLIAMEMLDRFLEKFRWKEEAGENRYLLLRKQLAENRYLLYQKVLDYFATKLDM